MSEKKKVLMVCLGNICRSPIAEGVFQHITKEKGLSSQWMVDSAAVAGYHIGKSPDHRALLTMKNQGISYNNKARQVSQKDFETFDFIFGMDEENISDLKGMANQNPNCKATIGLLGDYDPEGERIIRDPYYDSGAEGFKKCYQQCLRSCTAFLEQHS
ncbi:low molecular weight phosphotyrosine protein phosphatase-like isoform X1 [Harmonia axyridis]|uniref:low molecular weight phosphotyrosine protein phosphatase-like isoform X1 n=1 Tax=Harmonia axyridis TaxID=115357 RepID=UPI001E2794EB|nr:low molecular weight phosphotyrosine protein phosphatase-like isoform X1 [Harmonia axyridis]